VVVSHDRTLLRQMDRTVELSGLGAKVYGGNYDLYVERKAQEDAAAIRDLENAERRVGQAAREAQVARERKARRDAAGKRFAAKGMESRLFLDAQAERAEVSGAREARLANRLQEEAAGELAEAQERIERLRKLDFALPASGLALGKTVLAFEEVSFAYPGQAPLIDDLSLRIVGPERVAIVGPNGSGKTTLVKLASGQLQPAAGRVVVGARAALFDQKTEMLGSGETLLEAFRRLNPAASRNDAQAALARFLFRNTAAGKQVDALSGGERLRAALACVLMSAAPPQLLILDEPTNHLDLDSIAAVEAAIRGYDGAILVVSHDQDFLEAVGIERRIEL
jgi:ATPase subunit of ABC transporter with duplicated ATPase domains